MLMLAYGASVGGLLTPVGTPPNLIGRGLIEEATGERISFGQWMALAFPICLLMFVLLAFILLRLNKPEIKRIDGVADYVKSEREKLGSMSRAEKNTLIAFGITVTLWVLPGIVALITGTESNTYEFVSDRLDEGVVAVFGAALLFLLPTDWKDREFTLRWSDAAEIDWGTIILFGCGIIFGSLISETGLAETIGRFDQRLARPIKHRAHHDLRGGPGDPRFGDDEQHGIGGCGGADRDPGGDGRRCEPLRACPSGDVRGVVRLHAAGVDAAERDRLRLWRRQDHDDDQVRDCVGHRGRANDHHSVALDGQRPRVGPITAHTDQMSPTDIAPNHDERESFIVDSLVDAFSDLMAADPDAFRTKFRKMAADPFAFFRGSACLFYADVSVREDRWADERTSRVWIQGDLHARTSAPTWTARGC